MRITDISYIPMATPSAYSHPAFMVALVVAAVILLTFLFIGHRKIKERALYFLSAALITAVSAVACLGIATFIQDADPVYGSTYSKIISNVEAKYDIASVKLNVPGDDASYVKAENGNYLSNAWVTRIEGESVVSYDYDLVVDSVTGEPRLKMIEDNAASQTDPATFQRS